MQPGKHDLTFVQGSRFDVTISYRDDDDELVDLTGYAARLHVRNAHGSSSTLLELTSGVGGGITLGGILGTVRLRVPATETADFDWTAAVYDLELVPPAGEDEAVRILEGRAILSRQVTR